MNLPQLKEQLTKKQVSPLYVFSGPEAAVMDTYVDKIAAVLGTEVVRVDALSNIFSRLRNRSIVKSRACFVIRDDKEYLQQEKVWDAVISGQAQGDNVIVLIYTNLDKRGKFYKRHADLLTEFERMSADVLAKHIKKQIGLDAGAELAEMCACDYGRIMLECDKLQHLSNAKNIPIDVAFKVAKQDKLIYVPPTDAIFELIDSVCRREEARSFSLWEELQARKESPLAVISLLYSNFRSMLLVQSAGNGEGICDRTGLTAWQVKLAKEKIGQYGTEELVHCVRTIRSIEKGIKTGTVDQEMAVDVLLVQVLR
jgi:DNA polymerase III delta subunit